MTEALSAIRVRLVVASAWLVAAGAVTPALAQQNSDGSVYSRFGIGELYSNVSSQVQAMGGGGTALSTFNYTNLANPGTWGDQLVTRLAGGVVFQGLDIKDATGASSRLNSSMLGAFQFSFPLNRGKWGFVMGYAPYSRVAHRVQLADVVVDDPSVVDPAAYRIRFVGSGGLQSATLGTGYRLGPFASIGGAIHFNFGILEESRFTEFTTSDYGATQLNLSTRLAGVSGTFGGLVTLRGVASETDALTFGLSLSTPSRLEGIQTITTGTELSADTLDTPDRGTIELPLRTNVGIAYYPSRRWTIVLDATIEPWDRLDGDIALAGFAPDGTSLLDRRTRLSGGFEFLPSVNPLDRYFQRTAYRLGGYTDTGYVIPDDGVNFRTTALTGGISLPTLFAGTSVDIGFEIGRRGSTALGFVRESFYKILVHMNIGERWFDRRKLG
jgi:hypothetical protein